MVRCERKEKREEDGTKEMAGTMTVHPATHLSLLSRIIISWIQFIRWNNDLLHYSRAINLRDATCYNTYIL